MTDLPEKYKGIRRIGLNERAAEDMLRMDALVEERGIKPGDAILLGFIQYVPGKTPPEPYTEWSTVPVIFVCVDNGRLIYVNEKKDWDMEVAAARAAGESDETIPGYVRNSEARGGLPTSELRDLKKI